MKHENERRRHPRYPVNLPVKWRILSSDPAARRWHTSTVLNVGDTGAFLHTRRPLKCGMRLELKLPFPKQPVAVQATARWISKAWPTGAGLQLAISSELTEKIIAEVFSGRWHSKPETGRPKKEQLQFFGCDVSELI